MSDKKPLNPEVRKYFQEIGRIRGNQLKEKYGSDYFKKIASMRKLHGREKPKPDIDEVITE